MLTGCYRGGFREDGQSSVHSMSKNKKTIWIEASCFHSRVVSVINQSFQFLPMAVSFQTLFDDAIGQTSGNFQTYLHIPEMYLESWNLKVCPHGSTWPFNGRLLSSATGLRKKHLGVSMNEVPVMQFLESSWPVFLGLTGTTSIRMGIRRHNLGKADCERRDFLVRLWQIFVARVFVENFKS